MSIMYSFFDLGIIDPGYRACDKHRRNEEGSEKAH